MLEKRAESTHIVYLQKTVPYKDHEQSVTVTLQHATRVLRCVHRGKIKHGHVRLAVVIHRELHIHHLVFRREFRRFPRVQHQRLAVHVLLRQQLRGVSVILN